MLAAAAGLKGVIILFDEFENMLSGLKRYDYKSDAFWNLLQFGRQKQFPGLSAFAVTPAFFQILGTLSELKQFPTFEMQPLEVSQLQELAARIRDTHALAFGWNPQARIRDADLRAIVRKTAAVPIEDRSRQTVKQVVSALDAAFEEIQ